MINPYDGVVDLIHVADIDESHGTYVDDAYIDNHDYDDGTDDDVDETHVADMDEAYGTYAADDE